VRRTPDPNGDGDADGNRYRDADGEPNRDQHPGRYSDRNADGHAD
jgi:hypothetical protein